MGTGQALVIDFIVTAASGDGCSLVALGTTMPYATNWYTHTQGSGVSRRKRVAELAISCWRTPSSPLDEGLGISGTG